MIISYFKVAFRNLWNNKLFSAINIGGLAIGVASSILLLSYVSFQFSYDNFHANKKDIYRIGLALFENNKQLFQSAENYSGVAPALKKDFPEIIDAARLYNMGYKNNCVFTYKDKHFKETKFLYADASFLSMFSFPFVGGNPITALSEPYTAVLSESFSKKLFGDQSAIGKYVQMDDDDRNLEQCRITGVFKDIPENSHLKFSILISYPTLFHRRNGRARYDDNLDRKDFYTYIQLRPGVNPILIGAKLASFVARHIPEEKVDHKESKLILQPLQKIHLSSAMIDEPEATGNEKTILFLIIISFFILIIAWVNYINLATANSLNRAKEIGIRKVLGSQRRQLIMQFLTESISINTLSLTIALILLYLSKPLLAKLLSIDDFTLSSFFSTKYGIIFIGFMCAGSFLSGLYPAIVLSSFKPISVLKGKVKTSKNGITLRKSLVVFQFSLSIFLILGTFIVYQQMRYMLNQNIGLNVSQVLALDRPGRWDTARASHNLYVKRFKNELKKDPAIEAIGMSDELPGKEIRYPGIYTLKNSKVETVIPINTIGIDEDYLRTLGIKILDGRNFSLAYKMDSNALIITESAASLLGFKKSESPIGKQVFTYNTPYTIIGVVNDFHHESLIKKSSPTVFQLIDDTREFEYYLIKIKASNAQQAVEHVRNAWNDDFKDNPFSFTFLDEYFNRQYINEIQFGELFAAFSIIAIVIASIGLFALVAYMIRQRTSELGIRKVLGAGLRDLIYLLTKDYMRLVLLANLIAWPLGWLLMNNWLKDFAYRIHISWIVFIGSGAFAFLIAIATISVQAIKAALANPSKSLRTE